MRALLVGALAITGCLKPGEFRCETSADCDRGGATGICQSIGYCSFADPSCDSGQRFADLSGELTNTCVDATGTFAIGGTLSGLAGSVTLANNGSDELVLTADGEFTFAARLADGADYGIAVTVQPSGQTCAITNGNGTIAGADITDVVVTCGAVTSATVACATGVACPFATEICCLDDDAGAGVCQASGAQCTDKRVECDDAADCGGGGAVCCATYGAQNNLRDITCKVAGSCVPPMAGHVELVCDPGAPVCPGGMTCTGTPAATTPGYAICE